MVWLLMRQILLSFDPHLLLFALLCLFHRCVLSFSVRALEKARNTGQFAQSSSVGFDGSESESSVEGDLAGVRRKKLKTA